MKFKVGPYSLEIGEKKKAQRGGERKHVPALKGGFGKRPKTRKELRKEQRQLKKSMRNENHAQRRKEILGLATGNKQAESSGEGSGPTKSCLKTSVPEKKEADKAIGAEIKKQPVKKKAKKEKKMVSIVEEQIAEKEKEEKKKLKLQEEMELERTKQLRKANKDEDKVIKQLEKKLYLRKRKGVKKKNLPKSFVFDGLDYLIEACDPEKMKGMADEPGWEESGSDFEDDLPAVAKKKKQNDDASEEESMEGNESEETAEESEDDENSSSDEETQEFSEEEENESKVTKKIEKEKKKVRFQVDLAEEQNDDNVSQVKVLKKKGKTLDDDSQLQSESRGVKRDNEDDEEEDEESETELKENSEIWEDIYGRLRDKEGNLVKEELKTEGAYVPPAKRALSTAPDAKKAEEMKKLQRILRGLLNRLSENNMHGIAVQIEEYYREHSQNTMNTILTGLILDLVNPAYTPERFIIEHALLVSILHANVGSEVGAHFLQTLAEKLDKQFNMQHLEEESTTRELDNILMLLCHVYNFGVVHCCLIFDILKKLGEQFKEKDLDMILLILRNVGFSLRKDDPVALKETILQFQAKAGAMTDVEDKSRIRFLLDVLAAIKNNNMQKIPNYDPTPVEHLKKLMKQFVRKGCYVSELKISLEDLVKANERGRWWIVGSAWTGMLPGEREAQNSSGLPVKTDIKMDKKLLELARQQRMNTDARKNIFCIIMSAEDYADAFEKLLRLGLKNEQERAIIHVILDCCMQEKMYNPYYSYLAQRFCNADRKYQLTLQFNLWDKLKEMHMFTRNQIRNLASILTHLFNEKALPLSVLKVIQFAEINKTMVRFLRQILLGILLQESGEVCQEIFARISSSSKLHMLREGLRLFMHHFLLKKKNKLDEEEAKRLEIRVSLAEQALMGSEGRLKL